MVENAYKVTLATAFVPLAFGLYWKRASTQGALASIMVGLVVWVLLEIVAPEADVPPHFAGMLAGIVGMIAGSLLPQTLAKPVHGHVATHLQTQHHSHSEH